MELSTGHKFGAHHVMQIQELRNIHQVNIFLTIDEYASWEDSLPPISDWRSTVVANELYQLERPGFAWEFLRRNHGYRKAYASLRRRSSTDGSDEVVSDAKLARWGLSFRMRPGSVRSSGKGRMAAGIHPDRNCPRAGP